MPKLRTVREVSAGGVVTRLIDGQVQVALIAAGRPVRWQLPKGIINPGESVEAAALREVREETGVVAEVLTQLDAIEYWFFATQRGERVRIHKQVHFYLMRYLSGDVADHDHEVHEARWVEIDVALAMLTYESERQVMEKARALVSL